MRYGRNESKGAGLAPSSSLWSNLCTHFSAWVGRGHQRRRRSGSSERCWPHWTPRICISPPCVLGGGASPPRAVSMLARLMFFPGRTGVRKECLRCNHIAQTEGWSWGSRSDLHWGRSWLTPLSAPEVGVSTWWQGSQSCTIYWGVKG